MSAKPNISARARQRGISIVTAIFLIVVLAALAAFAVSVFRAQRGAAALDILGARALQAAQAGIEWGAWNALRNPPKPAPPAVDVPPACPAPTTLAFPAGTTLAAFSVTVICTRSQHTEAGNTVTMYSFVSTACNLPPCPNPAPGVDYVERQAQGSVER